MKQILFIINPKSGVDRKKSIEKSIAQHIDAQKFQYKLAFTEYAKHGAEIAKQAVLDKVDIVAVVGGDGSINDVLDSLAGSDTALAILPKGSGNGLARSLEIPINVKEALLVINKQKYATIDLGTINDKLFVSNAGVGFDAVITEKFSKSKIRGFKSYSKIIAAHLLKYKPLQYRIEVDGQGFEEKAFMITVANGIQLGYGFKIAPKALLDDGVFDVIILKKFYKIFAATIAIRAFTGKILKSKYVRHLSGRRILISHPNLNTFQYDGEAATCSDSVVEIELSSRKLKVLIP